MDLTQDSQVGFAGRLRNSKPTLPVIAQSAVVPSSREATIRRSSSIGSLFPGNGFIETLYHDAEAAAPGNTAPLLRNVPHLALG
ncbi:MAG: hypothetical protein KAU31_11520, partial [Spirochaetaceae bacterium]|nr:hypothetical protein [Spirochaetaceae bacterium]